MTDDFYVVRGLSQRDTIPPTIPFSALTSTAEFDDTTFSFKKPTPFPDESITVSISEYHVGSAEDSTNLALFVGNGYPDDAGGHNFRFFYKIGSAFRHALTGARVNGHDWGDQSLIDHAIVLSDQDETPKSRVADLDVYPNPFTERPSLRVQVEVSGFYIIEV